jgi:hypothetical protein
VGVNAWVDIENDDGDKLGGGPLTEILRFRATRRMNRAGEWTLSVPATDPRAVSLLEAQRTALCYCVLPEGGGPVLVGGGVIAKQTLRIAGQAEPTLEIGGIDLLGELARDTVGELKLDGTGPDNLDDLLALLPAGWTSDVTGTCPGWVARYVHETPLGALVALAERLDAVFRLAATPRELEWFVTPPTAVVARLFLDIDPVYLSANGMAGLITDIQRVEDSAVLLNKAYVYGAGDGEARLTLASAQLWPDDTSSVTTPTWNDGTYTYTIDKGDNSIRIASSITTYGTRAREVSFKDIAPLTNTDVDVSAAADMLVKAAVAHLRTHALPVNSYRVSVAGLQVEVLPGDVVLVDARVYRDGDAPIVIQNEALTVLEATSELDGNALRTVGLVLSEARRWPSSAELQLASDARKNLTMEAHPQMGPSVDTISYREHIDDDHSAILRFWLGPEVTLVNQIICRVRVDPLRSTVKSVGASGSTIGAGTSHSHTVTIASHTHPVALPDHTHPVPDHDHYIPVYPQSGSVDNVNISFTGGAEVNLGYFEVFGSGNKRIDTAPDSGAVTSEDGGGTTIASAGGGASAPSSSADTAHTHPFTPTINMEYGVFDEAGGNTYAATDLEYQINGAGGYTAVAGSAVSGWYALDLTGAFSDPDTKRPVSATNSITFRVRAASKVNKTVQLTAQIERRTVIQSIAVL